MTDDYIYRDMRGNKINPQNLKKFDRFSVLDRRHGDKIGTFTKKDWERKFR